MRLHAAIVMPCSPSYPSTSSLAFIIAMLLASLNSCCNPGSTCSSRATSSKTLCSASSAAHSAPERQPAWGGGVSTKDPFVHLCPEPAQLSQRSCCSHHGVTDRARTALLGPTVRQRQSGSWWLYMCVRYLPVCTPCTLGSWSWVGSNPRGRW